MASVNHATKEVNCKMVYYGPGMCGKTTNLQYLHEHHLQAAQNQLVSLATPGERTLYFDFLPIEVAAVQGYRVKFGLYTVPGQVMYNATRKLVLRGADGIIFVADSQWKLMDENVESLENMQQNLREHGLDLDSIPFVMQYNKRDLPDTAPRWYLHHLLNTRNVPEFEAVAVDGRGVYDTLNTLSRYVLRTIVHRIRTGSLSQEKF